MSKLKSFVGTSRQMTSSGKRPMSSNKAAFGKVKSPELYNAVYHESFKMAKSGTLPMHRYQTGKKLMRSIPGGQPYTNMNGARTISPVGHVSTGNRYSGIKSTGPGHGALYLGEWNAVRAEMHHYQFEKPLLDNPKTPVSLLRAADMGVVNRDTAFIKQVNYELVLIKGIDYVNSDALQKLLVKNPNVLDVISVGTNPITIFQDPSDVSGCRGIADAIYDSKCGYNGVSFMSTRGYDDVQGLNVAHFGEPSEFVPIYDVKQAYVYATKNDGKSVIRVYRPDISSPDFGQEAKTVEELLKENL